MGVTETFTERISTELSDAIKEYGLAFIMVASYFGSGTVFIASQAGVMHGYTLLWAVVGAVLFGVMAQDMSARLGIHGEPLMIFVRRKLGNGPATGIAVFLSIGCVAWCLGLVAAVGAGVSFLTGGAVAWQPIALVTTVLAIGVGLLNYQKIEQMMVAMMLLLMVLYLTVAGASNPDLGAMAPGFVPTSDTIGAFEIAAGLLGTTALWPNFFLESILVEEKGWTDESDVSNARRDLTVGFTVGGTATIAILVVAVAVLQPMGYTELESFVTPGEALVEMLGTWAMVLFVAGVTAAAFNSIIPIMWTPAYIIPQAMGVDVDQDSRLFKLVFISLTATGFASPLISSALNLQVIDMAILFPTYNGIFGLPLAALLLFWSVNDRETMGEYRNTTTLNVINASLVLLAFVLAIFAVQDFLELLFGGGF